MKKLPHEILRVDLNLFLLLTHQTEDIFTPLSFAEVSVNCFPRTRERMIINLKSGCNNWSPEFLKYQNANEIELSSLIRSRESDRFTETSKC